jgi:hypothetical protein
MKPRPRAPHSLLPTGITGRRPLERDLIRGWSVTEMGTDVKGCLVIRDAPQRSSYAGLTRVSMLMIGLEFGN